MKNGPNNIQGPSKIIIYIIRNYHSNSIWVFSLNSATNFIFSTICFTNSTTHIFYLSFTTAPLRIEQSVQLKFYLGGIKWPRMGSSSKTESILNRFFPGLCNVDCGDFNMREYLSSHKLVIRDWCSIWNWHRYCHWYCRCYIVKIFTVAINHNGQRTFTLDFLIA